MLYRYTPGWQTTDRNQAGRGEGNAGGERWTGLAGSVR